MEDRIFKDIKTYTYKWWEKVFLFFITPKYSLDITDKGTSYVFYKRLFGKTYVVDSGFDKTIKKEPHE